MNLNDAAAAMVDAINKIDDGIHFFPTATLDHPDEPQVTGEIAFRQAEHGGAFAQSAWAYEAILTLTTQANMEGWQDALFRMREYASPFGPKSIFQAFARDQTLGGKVRSCLPKQGGLLDERRIKFGDGDRWTQDMTFEVRIGPEETWPNES